MLQELSKGKNQYIPYEQDSQKHDLYCTLFRFQDNLLTDGKPIENQLVAGHGKPVVLAILANLPGSDKIPDSRCAVFTHKMVMMFATRWGSYFFLHRDPFRATRSPGRAVWFGIRLIRTEDIFCTRDVSVRRRHADLPCGRHREQHHALGSHLIPLHQAT